MQIEIKLIFTKSREFLSRKIPIFELEKYWLARPKEIGFYIEELNLAIKTFNSFKKDLNFINREYYVNALSLEKILEEDLPEVEEIFERLKRDEKLMEAVFIELRDNNYFKEVWKIKSMEFLTINLWLLIYRTAILQINKKLLIDKGGRRIVEICSSIEEITAYLYLHGKAKRIFPAFEIWLKNWKEEGFDQRLYKMLYITKKGS